VSPWHNGNPTKTENNSTGEACASNQLINIANTEYEHILTNIKFEHIPTNTETT